MFHLSTDDVKKVITNAIGNNHRILSYSLEPFSASKEGLLGTHLLLKVSVVYEQNSVDDCNIKILSFFVKSLPESELIQDLMDGTTFEGEVNFFKNVLPLMLSDYKGKPYSPRCYLAEDNILVLEDLRTQGFAMNNGIMSENLLKSSIASLARFHASTLLTEAKLGKPLNEAFPTFFSEKVYNDSTKLGQVALLGFKTIVSMADKLDLDASFVLPHMYDYVRKSVKSQKGELNVLCHNDLWQNNILFNKKVMPECVFVDYQLLRYATPVADLSSLLYLNTTPEFRKKFEMDMVNHYYSTFQQVVGEHNVKIKIPTPKSILGTYKKYRLIGMVTAAMDLPGINLDPETLQRLLGDPEALSRFMICDRMDIIDPYLETNIAYAKQMKDLLSEVLSEGRRVLNISHICEKK